MGEGVTVTPRKEGIWPLSVWHYVTETQPQFGREESMFINGAVPFVCELESVIPSLHPSFSYPNSKSICLSSLSVAITEYQRLSSLEGQRLIWCMVLVAEQPKIVVLDFSEGLHDVSPDVPSCKGKEGEKCESKRRVNLNFLSNILFQ